MPKKAENTFSLLHIPVLVKSKNVFCHCVQIFMGILEICEPTFPSSNFTILWLFEKYNCQKKNLKFLAAEFLEFALKIFLNTEKYNNLVNF